jgi:hypothetical protein
MPADHLFIDFNNPSSANIALGAASVDAALPANCKLLGVTTTGNCHFRLGPGVQTAVVTDPMLTPNSEIQIIVVPGDATHIAVIQDGQTPNTGNFNFFRVAQG